MCGSARKPHEMSEADRAILAALSLDRSDRETIADRPKLGGLTTKPSCSEDARMSDGGKDIGTAALRQFVDAKGSQRAAAARLRDAPVHRVILRGKKRSLIPSYGSSDSRREIVANRT